MLASYTTSQGEPSAGQFYLKFIARGRHPTLAHTDFEVGVCARLRFSSE
jgi:hypothetical protein